MVAKSGLRLRHTLRSSTGGNNNLRKPEEKSRSADCANHSVKVHAFWPEMPQGQGELFFECTLFLYSVLALFLQYLNLYKTLWWLPKSYWHHSMKFHLVNPYLLSCVGLLLGLRVTRCFWKTVTYFATVNTHASSGIRSFFWKVVEWAVIKVPMFIMVTSSFLFSFSRVYNDFPFKSLLYFGHPFLLFVLLYSHDILYKLQRVVSMIYYAIKGGGIFRVQAAPSLYPAIQPSLSLIDIENVLHICSSNPVQIREEVGILIRDFNLRIKHCLFSGLSTAYLAICVPCVFTPQKSQLGVPQQMWVDGFWVCELFVIVFLTSFSLYVIYLLPIYYCDLLHRSALHLGCWEQVHQFGGDQASATALNSTGSQIVLWSDKSELYLDGSMVQHKGNVYRACAAPGTSGIAAEPGGTDHCRFYRLAIDPMTIINGMCIFQMALILSQFWMLVLTTDWQHIVTLVLLMFTNYFLLGKVLKDRVVIGRIYKPSAEDLLLMQQLQKEAAS